MSNLRDIRNAKFFWIDNDFVDDERITHKEIAVYAVLCRHANHATGSCFPSIATICKKTDLSKSTVIRVIKNLIEWGYISKEKRSDDEQGTLSNMYYIMDISAALRQNSPLVSGEYTPSVTEIQGGCQGDTGGVSPVDTNNTKFNKTKVTIKSPRSNVSKCDYSSEFEEIWEHYPRKKEKKKAYQAFLSVLKNYPIAIIRNGVQGYADEVKKNRTEERYIKHAATFFNGECFNDYAPKEKELNQPPKQPSKSFSIMDM